MVAVVSLFFAFVCLFHGSQTDNIETLEPRKRHTPGGEANSPAGIYATDDPAYATAHAFPWSSSEGIDLYYGSNNDEASEHVILEIPQSLESRLKQPIFIYEISPENFELLPIPPYGHNYRSLKPAKCIAKKRFETVIEAVNHYGGTVKIKAEE